jgi:hypothetical protein
MLSTALAFLHGLEVNGKNRAQIRSRACVLKVPYTSSEIVPSGTHPAYLTPMYKAHFCCFEVLTVVLLKIRLLDHKDKGITIPRNGSTTASHSTRRSVCQEYGPTNPSQLTSLHETPPTILANSRVFVRDPVRANTLQCCSRSLVRTFNELYVHVTVHRDNLRINDQQDTSSIQNFILSRNSTCFGHLLCPSSGVISCTRSNCCFMHVMWPLPRRVRF